jgi:hypothetical protein
VFPREGLRERQAERRHLLAVADQEDVADQHRVFHVLPSSAGARAISVNFSGVAETSATSPSSESTSSTS